jgi:hypothetical protein
MIEGGALTAFSATYRTNLSREQLAKVLIPLMPYRYTL